MAASAAKIFAAEAAGTFLLVVCATGSVVLDARHGLGMLFVAFAPFAGVAAGVYMFGKISMAHLNPAVTVGFLITGHITRAQVPCYLAAQLAGAVCGSLLVLHAIGPDANLGANAPDPDLPAAPAVATEVLATCFLMAVILVVVRTGGLRGLGGIAIGGAVFLDIFFLGSVSGASMNPARSLAPALLSGHLDDLWLYWSAPFAGAAAAALAFRVRRPRAEPGRQFTNNND